MQRLRHASPRAGSNGSQPSPAKDRTVQGTDTDQAGNSEESPDAPEDRRPRFLLVLLQALSAWST